MTMQCGLDAPGFLHTSFGRHDQNGYRNEMNLFTLPMRVAMPTIMNRMAMIFAMTVSIKSTMMKKMEIRMSMKSETS